MDWCNFAALKSYKALCHGRSYHRGQKEMFIVEFTEHLPLTVTEYCNSFSSYILGIRKSHPQGLWPGSNKLHHHTCLLPQALGVPVLNTCHHRALIIHTLIDNSSRHCQRKDNCWLYQLRAPGMQGVQPPPAVPFCLLCLSPSLSQSRVQLKRL